MELQAVGRRCCNCAVAWESHPAVDTTSNALPWLPPSPSELAPLIQQLGPPDRLLAKHGSNFATRAKAIVVQARLGVWGSGRSASVPH